MNEKTGFASVFGPERLKAAYEAARRAQKDRDEFGLWCAQRTIEEYAEEKRLYVKLSLDAANERDRAIQLTAGGALAFSATALAAGAFTTEGVGWIVLLSAWSALAVSLMLVMHSHDSYSHLFQEAHGMILSSELEDENDTRRRHERGTGDLMKLSFRSYAYNRLAQLLLTVGLLALAAAGALAR